MALKSIVITFGAPVELPTGFEHALSALVGLVCDQYQKAHPDRVMWTAGHGFAPTSEFYFADFENPSGKPMFDESCYTIDCAEREDMYGENPSNPNREALRKAVKAARDAERAARKPQWPKAKTAVRTSMDAPSCVTIMFDREPTDEEIAALKRGLE